MSAVPAIAGQRFQVHLPPPGAGEFLTEAEAQARYEAAEVIDERPEHRTCRQRTDAEHAALANR